MAEKKYLNEVGLAEVATHVNTRLKTVTTIPVSADDGAVRLYVGTTNNNYTKGHVYQYDLANTTWKDITNFSIIFTGTTAEWNALSLVEKQVYDICNITDDVSENNYYTESEVDALLDTKANVTAITNPNLLDNPWFTINQRGFTTGNTMASYTVDRWRIQHQHFTSVTLSNDVITLLHDETSNGSELAQYFEYERLKDAVGKPITLSIMLSNGNVYSDTAILPTAASTAVIVNSIDNINNTGYYCKTGWRDEKPYVRIGSSIANDTISIKAVKLELGSVSTLAMDTVPNYTTELLKCQRYFTRIKGFPSTDNVNTLLGMGLGFTDSINVKAIKSSIILPTTMRYMSPSMTISNANDLVYETGNSSTRQEATSVSSLNGNGNVISYYIRGNSITDNQVYYMNLKPNAYIDLSADL